MAKALIRGLDYAWRLFATAVSFAVFGVGGMLLWWLVLPVLALRPGLPAAKQRRAQYAVHLSFYTFIGLMHRLGVMTYRIDGLEKLNRPGQLIVANHPTLVDVVFLLSRIQHASCIVKASLWRNPAMRGPILHAGYISNADSQAMLDACAERLREGGCLIVFPEGTRSVPGRAYRFQRGAAALALQADCLVTPVVLRCRPSTLTKAEPWYRIPARRFALTMQVGDAIDIDAFRAIEPRSIAVRRLTETLQDYFSERRMNDEHDGN
ncbi:lysophospholipid acyltransferase family protein [Methylomonas sp. CM2]|uniref:lysophospholipid acyltransferase family protein n=1 Tax=Methylomonas sp. CM2 TaxID=3417647 RepID=UPI003CEB7447